LEFPFAIKPVTFNPKYLLFGNKTFKYNNPNSILASSNPNIRSVEKKNFRQDEILKAKRKMQGRISFDYPEEYVMPLSKCHK